MSSTSSPGRQPEARALHPADDGDEDAMIRTMPVTREQLQLIRGVDVAATLLSVVAEKTGYPMETLELSQSLDGDLGVDSIKRVEILSAIQEKLPRCPW